LLRIRDPFIQSRLQSRNPNRKQKPMRYQVVRLVFNPQTRSSEVAKVSGNLTRLRALQTADKMNERILDCQDATGEKIISYQAQLQPSH
jgi:hypothetical protein